MFTRGLKNIQQQLQENKLARSRRLINRATELDRQHTVKSSVEAESTAAVGTHVRTNRWSVTGLITQLFKSQSCESWCSSNRKNVRNQSKTAIVVKPSNTIHYIWGSPCLLSLMIKKSLESNTATDLIALLTLSTMITYNSKFTQRLTIWRCQ